MGAATLVSTVIFIIFPFLCYGRAMTLSLLPSRARKSLLSRSVREAMAVKLLSRYRKYGHHFYGFSREDREVRMVFEELRGGFMRVRTYDRECSHVIAFIFDTFLSDLLSLAERPTHANNRCLVFFDPRLPCCNSLLFLCSPLRFGEGVPSLPLWAGFAAEENNEIGVVRAHYPSFLTRCG